MLRLLLHPRWLAWHLALLLVLAAFGWLGWWQLSTFDDEGVRAADKTVVALQKVTDPGGRLERADVGRVVRASGTWAAEGQVLAPERRHRGRDGAWVVTPLRTDGGVLPVVRGWVPRGTPAPAPPGDPVTVTAVLQPSESESDARGVPSAGEHGTVPYISTVTLISVLPDGASDVYDPQRLYDGFAVLRTSTSSADPALEPVEPQHEAAPEAIGRWRNLGYGLQWWVFGAGAVYLWLSVLRRAAREQPVPPASP